MANEQNMKLIDLATKYDPAPMLAFLDSKAPPPGAMNPKLMQSPDAAPVNPGFIGGAMPPRRPEINIAQVGGAPGMGGGGAVAGRNVPTLGKLINGKEGNYGVL